MGKRSAHKAKGDNQFQHHPGCCIGEQLDVLIPAAEAGLTDDEILVDPHLGYIFTLAGVAKLLQKPPIGEDAELFFRYVERAEAYKRQRN